MAKRSRRGYRPAPNPNTRKLRAEIAQRRRELAVAVGVRLANQRAVIAARLARGQAEAEKVIAARPALTAFDYIEQAKVALDKADELLGIKRPDAPTDVPAGAQIDTPETQEPPGAT